jgi:aquaporin Z
VGFFRHGRIGWQDAVGYTIAQVARALAAALAMRSLLGAPYAHPAVDYVVIKPGPAGTLVAFGAEFGISFVLMLALLVATESRRLQRATGWIAGGLLTVYVVGVTPLSGMSLNPARSLGSAVAASSSPSLWLYIVAPMVAMWLAVEVYTRLDLASHVADHPPGPVYPVSLNEGIRSHRQEGRETQEI